MRAIAVLLCFLLSLAAIATPGSLHANTDSLHHASLHQPDAIDRYHAMVLLASDLIPEKMDSARILLEKSSRLSAATDNPIEMAAWLNVCGNYMWYAGNRDSAVVNYSRTYALRVPEVLDRRAAAAVNLGALYRLIEISDSVYYFYHSARSMFEELGDDSGIAHVNYSLAIHYQRTNNYELALRYLLQSYEHQKVTADTFALIFTHVVLGNVYGSLNKPEKSRDHYKEAMAMTEKHPAHPQVPSIYNNLSHLYASSLDDIDRAFEYATTGIRIAKEREDDKILFSLYNNLGKMHHSKGDYLTALAYYAKARDHVTSTLSKDIIAGALVMESETHIELGDLATARALIMEGLEIATRISANKWMAAASNNLFHIDSIAGNYLQAIAHLQEANRIRDTIWKEERADRLAELEIIYEIDRKEAENLLLREANELKDSIISGQRRFLIASISASVLFVLLLVNLFLSNKRVSRKNRVLEEMHQRIRANQEMIESQNALLNTQKTELELLNQTKDKFFSVIAHDLRGPFTALLGLLQILADDFDEMDDDEKRQMIEDLLQTSRNTFNLTVNLLEWAKVQRGLLKNNPQAVDLAEVVDNTLSILDHQLSNKGHKVDNLLKPKEHTINADPNLLLSVMSNLINNAIKFTPAGGHIRIAASPKESKVQICVSDNGIGIPEEEIQALFDPGSKNHRPGTDNEKGTGLGLLLVKEFVSLMEGTVEVSHNETGGTTFCLLLPRAV